MENEHALSALIRKRAETAGRISHAQTALRQMVIDLDNLDATIRLFDPDIDLEEIRPKPVPPRHQAFRGEITRIVLETLRRSQKPLRTEDMAKQIMAARGLCTIDHGLMRTMIKRTGAALRHQRNKGHIRSLKGAGKELLWEIAQ